MSAMPHPLAPSLSNISSLKSRLHTATPAQNKTLNCGLIIHDDNHQTSLPVRNYSRSTVCISTIILGLTSAVAAIACPPGAPNACEAGIAYCKKVILCKDSFSRFNSNFDQHGGTDQECHDRACPNSGDSGPYWDCMHCWKNCK